MNLFGIGKGKPKRKNKQVPFSTTAAKSVGFLGIVSIELAIAGVIAATEKGEIQAYGVTLKEAWIWASLSVTLGLLSTYSAQAAQTAANDPRPQEKERATGLRVVSLLCVIIPALMLAEARTFPKQEAEHQIYVETGQKDADTAIIQIAKTGEYVEPHALADARANLQRKGTPPKTPSVDVENYGGEIIWAFMVYLLITQVPGFVSQPPAETEREAELRVMKEIELARQKKNDETTAKREKTRLENLKAKGGSEKKGWGSLINFPKKA